MDGIVLHVGKIEAVDQLNFSGVQINGFESNGLE